MRQHPYRGGYRKTPVYPPTPSYSYQGHYARETMAHLIVSSLLVLLALDLAYIVTELANLQLHGNSGFRTREGSSGPAFRRAQLVGGLRK